MKREELTPNPKRIARATNGEHQLHISGQICSNCGWQWYQFNLTNLGVLAGRTIQAGDSLRWVQWSSGSSKGGIIMTYGDGTDSCCSSAPVIMDQNGEAIGSGSLSSNQWEYRIASLTSVAGKSISQIRIYANGNSTPPQWDIYFQDLVYTAADGTVIPLFSQNPTVPALSGFGSTGMRQTSATINNCVGSGCAPVNTTTYYHGDQIGLSRLLTNGEGYPIWQGTFLPFGEDYNPQITTNHYKFAGQERDNESGLDLMGARYYGNGLGRFVQADPLYLEFHRLPDPQQLNLYTYGRNNPLKFTDPLGLDITCDGNRCNDYQKALQQNVSFKITMDKNGKIGTEGAIDKKHLSKPEKEILKAIDDENHHVTIHAIDGGKDAGVFFGRSDGNHIGSHTIAFDQAALLDSPKNAGGMTSAQLVGHETLEGYAESQGNSLQDAHNYANWYFGGFEVGGSLKGGTYGVQNGMVVQITGTLSVHGSSTIERITSQFATPIPQQDFLKGKGAPYPQYPINIEAVENKK